MSEVTDERLTARRLPALYLLGAVLQGLAPILVQPVAIRILDPQQWGIVAVCNSTIQVGLVVLSAGLPPAITRAYFDKEQGPRGARAIIAASSAGSMVLAVVIAAAMLPAAQLPYVIAVVLVGFLSTVLYAQAYLRAELKAVQFVVLTAGYSVGAQGCGLLAVKLFGTSALNFLLAWCAGTLITALAGLLLVRPVNPFGHGDGVRQALVIGLPIVPHSLALMLLMQGDGLLLKFLNDEVIAGRYLAAAPFAIGPIAVLAGLNNVWTPRLMAAWDKPTRRAEIAAVAKQALGVSVLLSVGGVAGSTIGVYVLAGARPELVELARVLPLLSTGYAMYLVAMSVLFAAKCTRVFAYVSAATAVVAGVVAYFPAGAASLPWLAVVKVLAFFVLGLAYAVLANRIDGVGLPVLRFCAAFAVVSVLGVASLWLPTDLFTGVIMLGALVVLAAAGALWWVRRSQVVSAR